MLRRAALLLAGVFSLSAAAEDAAVDYQTRFAAGFPDSGRDLDWNLYAALVANDLPAWAAAIDPSTDSSCRAHTEGLQITAGRSPPPASAMGVEPANR